ncbi:MAG: SDR family NAD(P)-dependent oxidoreductase [Hyphomonadaceae bacterium]|nr:SDR family NAD(P)-dependent oxidoreductase [Hyphomonadaceae bacterium]
MANPMHALLQAWRRRWWQPDPAALEAFAGLTPMTVVTGGSEGIGLELARRFAAAGHDVMLVARRAEPLRQAAHGLRAESKATVVVVPADVTAPDAIATIEAALAAHGAYADVLVNSAGMGLSGPFHAHPPDDVVRLIDLNVRALSLLTRHFLPGMRQRGRGGILNVASLGGYAPGPNQAAYYASKAYVLSLTEAVAAETAGEGVRVCALAPGPVNTAFHARMGAEKAFYRLLVPPASAQSVARAGYRGFVLGLRVTVPGLFNPLLALAMRIMPHRIVIPIIGWLLRPREDERRNV